MNHIKYLPRMRIWSKRCPTKKMLRAVTYCEDWNCPKFKGDIESFDEVSKYLGENLAYAKECAAESYIGMEDNLWK